jgi:hypothetical protein
MAVSRLGVQSWQARLFTIHQSQRWTQDNPGTRLRRCLMKAEKAEFRDGFAVGFAMEVPECFRESLAKKRFQSGDIIYDDRRAYAALWSDAIGNIAHAFQVIQMTGNDIQYVVLRKNSNGTSLVKQREYTVTISQFLELLRTGI